MRVPPNLEAGRNSGLEIVESKALGGPLRGLPLIDAVGLLIQVVSYLLDRIDKAEHLPCMYLVVARKK